MQLPEAQVAPVTNRPSPQYRQHHDVAEPRVDATIFRQGWRVSTRLDGLLRDGLIGPEGWQAGDDFRTTFERAHGIGMAPPGGPVGARAAHGDRIATGRIDAQARLRGFAQALGAERVWLIEQCAVHDHPWQRTAQQLGVSDKTARARTALALRALARA